MLTEPRQDLVDLRALVDRYGLLVDRRAFEAAAELFTWDGTLITSVPTTSTGRAEIRAAFQPALEWFAEEHRLEVDRLETQHFVGNHVCEFVRGRAQGVTYCLARLCDPRAADRSALINVLRYEDVYARTEWGWMFQSRTIHRLWSEQAQVSG